MNEPNTTGARQPLLRAGAAQGQTQYVSLTVADQTLGIPVLNVHDVLTPQRITRVPLAPQEVAGSLNLRGRIVTAIDVRRRLGLAAGAAGAASMSVVVEHRGEFYSLIVDRVGEVLTLADQDLERNPVNMDSRWRSVSLGIFRLDQQLLVILDIDRLLDFAVSEAA
jgi:purine-binding chemotaxis protein CheW